MCASGASAMPVRTRIPRECPSVPVVDAFPICWQVERMSAMCEWTGWVGRSRRCLFIVQWGTCARERGIEGCDSCSGCCRCCWIGSGGCLGDGVDAALSPLLVCELSRRCLAFSSFVDFCCLHASAWALCRYCCCCWPGEERGADIGWEQAWRCTGEHACAMYDDIFGQEVNRPAEWLAGCPIPLNGFCRNVMLRCPDSVFAPSNIWRDPTRSSSVQSMLLTRTGPLEPTCRQ